MCILITTKALTRDGVAESKENKHYKPLSTTIYIVVFNPTFYPIKWKRNETKKFANVLSQIKQI